MSNDVASALNSFEAVVAEADRLYAARPHIAKIEASVALMRTTSARTGSFAIEWRHSRALFFLGQEQSDRLLAQALHREGAAHAAQAVRLAPDDVAGYFWLGVNLGLLAKREGLLTSVVHAEKARRALTRAIARDASYHQAGPLRVLGRLQSRLPWCCGGGLP